MHGLSSVCGRLKSTWATPGEMMLDVAIDNAIDEDMHGMFGMCGGGMCCSTCHVILDNEVYRKFKKYAKKGKKKTRKG